MAVPTVTEVQRAYLSYFGRPADPSGLAFYTNAANNQTVASMKAAFAASPEYAAMYSGMNDLQRVERVYENVLGRTADSGGLIFWAGELSAGRQTVSTLVDVMLNSAAGTDLDTIANRLVYANDFTNSITTTAQILGYSGTAAADAARGATSAVVATAASLTAAEAALATTVASVVTAGTNAASQSFTLTTGVDTWGSATATGQQTFNGGVIDSLSTFDTLRGGASTTDSLTANITGAALPAGMTISGIETAVINTSGAGFAADFTGWTGLLSVTANDSGAGAVDITAATTTDVTASQSSPAGGAVTVTGGKNITTTQVGTASGNLVISGGVGAIVATDKAIASAVTIDGGTSVTATVTGQNDTTSTITIGNTVKPTGAITLAATTAFAANDTQGAITVKGGTTVSITDNLVANPADGTVTVTGGAIGVTGGSTTTSVSVSQTATATAATAITGVTGVAAVTAVTAAPGTQGVTAVTGVNYTAAQAATTGVVNGAVTIADANTTASTNTIATVALQYHGAASTITSNALNTLSLKGGGTLTLARTVANASPTFALTADSLTGTNNITDANNEITTLNVTTTGGNSTLASFTDTGLTTLNVSGTKKLTLSAINGSLTAITLSGSAGFSDAATAYNGGFAALGAAATFTTTSSGTVNLALDSLNQSFVGSTGVDTIIIDDTIDATKTITAGSATTDELILERGVYALTTATGAKVTGFEVLGLAANATGTVDVATLGSGNNFGKIHVIGNSTVTLANVAHNAAVTIDVASTTVVVGYADATGTADAVTLTLGASATATNRNYGAVTLKDANDVGIGTVNLVSNGRPISTGGASLSSTMVLTDNGLSTLNFSGTSGLTMTTLNEASTQATTITINNTNTSPFGLNIGTLTDASLGSLTFTGTGLTTIPVLTVASSTVLGLSNTGSQLVDIPLITTTAALRTLTLSGNIKLGVDATDATGTQGVTLQSTAGVTVSGATDNAHVAVFIDGAAVNKSDSVTLGNGNNVIVDATTVGTVNVTVGTGSNIIALGDVDGTSATTTGVYNVTLGTHTATSGPDYITVTTAGDTFATAANVTITGAAVGDRIYIGGDYAMVATGLLTATAAGATEAATITALEAAVTAGGITYAVFGGNTYVVESITGGSTGTLGAADTTVIKIVGSHTITATTDSGVAIDYFTITT
ncbi:MAG: DUF4214 domain-containing protein [Sterolibacterium sp.]|nr:DUF4214 domain-containing protein [Sterolibacterium sp.]